MDWNQGLNRWQQDISENPHLRQAWAVAIVWGAAGYSLLAVRFVGGLMPDADVVRSFGLLVFVVGAGLTSNAIANRWARQGTAERGHQFSIAMTTLFGMLMTSIALMPAINPLMAILTAFAIGGMVVLAGQQVLSPAVANQIVVETSSMAAASSSTSVETSQQSETHFEKDQQVWQQLSRTRLPDGVESIEGMLRVEFAAGQKQMAAHIALTPSMEQTPEIECEPLNGEQVEATIEDIFPHGFRIDIRRIGSAKVAETVEIGFQGSANRVSDHAA